MSDGQKTAMELELVSYLLSQVDQLSKIKALISKEGGSTKQDFLDLVAYHESERKRIGDYIDSLPDTPTP